MAGLIKIVLLLSIICLFCSVNSFQKKKGDIIEEKLSQLIDWKQKRSVLVFDGDKFRSYVKAAPKNYSVIVQFTALQSKRNCIICRQVNDEFYVVANSWRYDPHHNNQLFFISVDYDEAPDVFTALDISSVPLIMHYPPKGKPKKTDYLDINRMGFSGEVIVRWIMERTDIAIRFFRPPNYFGALVMAVVLSLVGVVVYVKRNSLEFLYNKSSWGSVAMMLIFAMTSGQMWNHIRGAQFMYTNPQTGLMYYIHASSQSQFVVESYIIMFLHAAIVAGILVLVEANSPKRDSVKRFLMAVVGLCLVVLFFSIVLSIFKAKHRGYPYSLLVS